MPDPPVLHEHEEIQQIKAKLVTRRGQLKGQLTRFKKFINDSDNDSKIAEMATRIQRIETIFDEFNQVQSELELLDHSEMQSSERDNFEDDFYESISKARETVGNYYRLQQQETLSQQQRTLPQNVPIPQPTENKSNFNIQLPSIVLPEFSGAYEKWPNFFDSFMALIDKNTCLSNIQKYYYLQASLKGEAAHVIESLEVSDSNYAVAWTLLRDRYENKKFIIKNHMKALFDLPVINKESFSSLRSFVDTFQKHYRALKNLNEPVELWSTILIHLLLTKLDLNTKREWEIKTKTEVSPQITSFITFLTDRCQILESTMTMDTKSNSVNQQYQPSSGNKKYNNRPQYSQSNISTNSTFALCCIYCKKDHNIYYCADFQKLSASDRLNTIRKLKACVNCLRLGHTSYDCRGKPCRICRNKHNSLLHLGGNSQRIFNNNSNNIRSQQNISAQENISDATARGSSTAGNASAQSRSSHSKERADVADVQQIVSCAQNMSNSNNTNFAGFISSPFVILSTALVNILNKEGKYVTCRALLDGGSQSNFVSKEMFETLNIDPLNVKIRVVGINGYASNICNAIKTKINSRFSNDCFDLQFLVTDKITTDTPQFSFNTTNFNLPNNINLSDPHFNESRKVDLLLGAGIFYNLLLQGQISLGKNLPLLQNTRLGWIVAGSVGSIHPQNILTCNFSECINLENKIEKFWLQEELPYIKNKHTSEEIEVEDHFNKTYTRDTRRNFVVRLPFRDDYEIKLGQSYSIAINRFQSLERKLTQNPELKEKYSKFMTEYIDLGHMSEINFSDVNFSRSHYFLPHHAVFKESSLTTKLRVVFDASSKTTSGVSLNDVLKIGPVIQDSLFFILLRFRVNLFVITADIAKMYRCVEVHNDDRRFQQIVWRDNPLDSLKIFQLNTVTYGTGPASFIATRCLKQLAIDNQTDFPEAASSINKDFYMDDWLAGSNDVNSILSLVKNVNDILLSGGFQLRQWSSNSKDVLNFISQLDTSIKSEYTIKDDQSCKTLGTLWNSVSDVLKYTTTSNDCVTFTKRIVLSVISQIFDPLGLLGPVIVRAKLFMQQLWQLKIGWDEPVSDNFLNSWLHFYNQLSLIKKLEIPRYALVENFDYIEMHVFTDASQNAFGTCIYFRSINSIGQIRVNLLCSKSRVAPLKVISLPRLELCAALLGAQLSRTVLEAMNNVININKIIYWCDSTIVLAWISSESSKLKTFVANRIAKIQTISQVDQWRHIPTSLNPADHVSRGVNPEDILGLNLWFQGPDFLMQSEENWPIIKSNLLETDLTEIKLVLNKTLITKVTIDDTLFTKYSSFNKLMHIIAYIIRFKHNSKCKQNREDRIVDRLTVLELDKALLIIIRYFQNKYFLSEINDLKKSNSVSRKSKLFRLSPFLDDNGVIRVGGRLKNADIPFDAKYQIVLPSKCELTSLIIRHLHYKHLHAGPQTLLSIIRQKYWPLQGRNTIRGILRRCVICFQVSPAVRAQKMGDLPSPRVQPSRPFLECGVDYCGPYLIKNSYLRNTKSVKAWICIFICMSSKAIHIELVSELSTDSFLCAFKRLIARRGLPARVYSDNATNFVGAYNIINEVKDETFQNFLCESRITWHFIPPRSPHHGGLWESAVRLTKFHLKRVLQNALLTYENLYSLLVQIESIVNSRPLMPLTEDPDDCDILTPGHFLIGSSLLALPENPDKTKHQNMLSYYKQLRTLFEQFWKSWSLNYLHHLQERSKWQTPSDQYQVGRCVLLHDDTVPLVWKLGRIVEAYPGSDGHIRVVSVKVKDTLFKRSISKISVLPIYENE